jgi:hypothetical protein
LHEQLTGLRCTASADRVHSAQCLISQIRQWDEPILVSLAAADMDQFALTVDIAYLQGQGLCKAQAHGIGSQQKNPIPFAFKNRIIDVLTLKRYNVPRK